MSTEAKNSMVLSAFKFMAVAIGVLFLDQCTKTVVLQNIPLYQHVTVIPSFFDLTHITNTGAAFGLMAGHEKWRHLFFQIVSFVALGGLFYLYNTAQDKTSWLFWGCSLIFGGAAGNLVDRIRFGHVIDFLDFYVGTYHWPAFNVADAAITMGGLFLAVHFLGFSSD